MNLVESNLEYETCIKDEDLKTTYPECPSFSPNSSDVTLFKLIADGIVSSTKNDANNSLRQATKQAINDERTFTAVLSMEEERM